MYFSIDKIEGDKATLIGEDRKPLVVPLSLLPEGSQSTGMLKYQDGAFHAAPQKTAEQQKKIAGMLSQLLNKDGNQR